MNEKDILAYNLKYYRYKSKLSQEKFAEALESSLKYVNQLEKQKRNPSLEHLIKISRNISKLLKTKITVADLLTYDKKKVIKSKRIDERN